MTIDLRGHQVDAVKKLRTGSILCGGVGSGKSRVALVYYFVKECGGSLVINGQGKYSPMTKQKDLYIITTARKRDSLEWEEECRSFLENDKTVVDSWNNIKKYRNVKDAFFIFDEQRVVGSGAWAKNFLRISSNNKWILLSATPGDTWIDYVPVFIANGFYKNQTEFARRHIVYHRFTRYPSINYYIDTHYLEGLRSSIVVYMDYNKSTISHEKTITVDFNKELFKEVLIKRWNIYEDRPIRDAGELCYVLRKIVNSDESRSKVLEELIEEHKRIIIFYNFNYELSILLSLGARLNITTAQWNGHKHELVPNTPTWFYLVQYTAGAEAWNCVETNTIVFYSQSYSYKSTVQAAGRIDRLNSPFTDLYYYYLCSTSIIDMSIQKALKNKKNFNESAFIKF